MLSRGPTCLAVVTTMWVLNVERKYPDISLAGHVGDHAMMGSGGRALTDVTRRRTGPKLFINVILDMNSLINYLVNVLAYRDPFSYAPGIECELHL